jgi:hypothetical protein
MDAQFLALPNSLLRNAPFAERSMKPNLAYVAVFALAYHVNGHIGMCGNHNAVDWLRQREDVRVAGHTFNFRGFRIDGKNFVTGVFQPSVYSIGWLALVSGYPCDADALATKEIGN